MDLSPLWLSLKTALVATVLAFYGGIALANWMFRSRSRASSSIDGLLTLPIVLPPTVVGFLLLLLLGRHGPVGQLLNQIGVSLIFSWPATVVAATVVALPLMYKTVLGAFKQIDPDLLGCARTLGASEGRIFWQVMLPLAQPGIIAGIILAFARALGEFGATLMLAGSIPGRTETMPIAIFLAAESGRMHEALFWVGVMIAIALASITALNVWSGPGWGRLQGQTPISVTLGPAALQFWGKIIGRFSLIASSGKRRQQQRVEHPQSGTGLTAVFQKRLPDFQLNVSLTAKNKPLGILGASGSGKSMTLRCIAGLETPDRGRIILNDRVLFDAEQGINRPPAERRISMMWQNYALFPHLTVAQNIGFGLEASQHDQVSKFLLLMQLEELANHYPHQLSGGQQQRVALARALAPQPEALLLDEPISALDSGLRSHLEDLLIQTFAAYQSPTLFVTHNLTEAYRVCDDLLVMAKGDAIAFGPKQKICDQPENYAVAQLIECQNLSRLQLLNDGNIQAEDWNCPLQVLSPISDQHRYVGIYGHHLCFTQDPGQKNTFPCWLVRQSATPHRISLYLKLHAPPADHQDYHLQADVLLEQWAVLKKKSLPWFLYFAPEKLMLMRS